MKLSEQQQRSILWACERVWLLIGMDYSEMSVSPKTMLERTTDGDLLVKYKFADEYAWLLQLQEELGNDLALDALARLSTFDEYEAGGAYA